ncbi:MULTISPECIES: DUF3667 domain-containing protein [Hyphobacterium]|uniref:DUF3667 domain-containing protein n=1 Tax=Hyphobacterium vulgare TaxID=1736751 RepID=A0ABV7A079_9PROT
MTGEPIQNQTQGETCANCGAPLSGDFCAACGQSREDIRRPAWSLVTDTLDGLLSWDGRILSTYRHLFTRPGQVARDYMDGKRQSFTPPVRLYLIVSLIFFAAISFSGIRIVGVDITLDEADEVGVFVSVFQPPRQGENVELTAEQEQSILDFIETNGIADQWRDVTLRAINHPELMEDQASAASSQAMILMVIVFALLCALMHPRRRMIEHAIYALYFHAALLLPLATIVIVGVYTRLPVWAAFTLLGSSILVLNLGVALFDRGFYGSSWFGSIVRSVVICMAYATCAGFVAIGLILWTAL